MDIRHNPIASSIATTLACSLLTACGGGGSGVVRSPPPPESRPPPTAAAPIVACPTPITSDCVVAGTQEQSMPGGRQSNHALVIGNETSPGGLALLLGDDSRFDGGVSILNGSLRMSGGSVQRGVDPQTVDGTILDADVTVGERGTFFIGAGGRTHGGILKGNVVNRGAFHLYGTVDGSLENRGSAVLHGSVAENVSNHGSATFSGVVKGNWSNDGRLDVGDVLNGATHNRIDGDFRQSAAGLLSILIPSPSTDWVGTYTSTLTVGGHAYLDGALELRRAWFDDGGFWYGYLIAPLPTAPTSIRILHAAGGVFGQFTEWKAASWLDENGAPRPLFITGSLRYGANDVWFDLTRVSIEAAMAAQSASATTLSSAGNLDRALAIGDGFTTAPNPSQARFLRSAGRLLWMDDAQQAARSLDSLAGSLHVDAVYALANDKVLARGIGARTLALQPGDHAGAWARVHGASTIAGFDQWLSPRLLAGATAAQARDARSDRLGGHAQHDSPQAALYLRWFGNHGWYAGGSAGYAQHALALDRRIDLAHGGQWNAHAQRRLGIASFDAEAGRRFSAGGMTVAPYLWLGADAIRSEAASEQGQTGLELTLQANVQASLDAGLGVRVGKRWSVGETSWLAFDADARFRQRLAQAGDPLRAAFIGVPDLWFDVPGHQARSGTWLDLGLRGGIGHGWAWSLGHAGSLAGQANGRHWQVGLARRF